MKVLNLYACLGGNRYKWDEVSEDLEITAVEIDPELARLYQERFPNDTVIVGDAHQYLLDHYKEFDFIWSSPPCPTHSRARFWGIGANGKNPVYPDMSLYQEIIFLEHHFKGKYTIENVIPYYEPFLFPQKRGRHLYWVNFKLPSEISERNFDGFGQRTKKNKYIQSELDGLCQFHEFDFKKYNGNQKTIKIARNLVDYEAGKTILEIALGIITKSNTEQTALEL
jgi:DNA (cytosine-5)-methyltransferase 1